MVAYSFKRRFAPPILMGAKAQTIRAPRTGRSRHARAGEQLQLYIGMRTRHCRRLGAPACTAVVPVRLVFGPTGPAELFQVNGVPLPPARMDAFAREDGFLSVEEMTAFWWAEHPGEGALLTFEGVLIRWQAFSDPELLAEIAPADIDSLPEVSRG
jgi:hypothetical protein